MATITWYVTNNLASVHQEMSETSPGADATASPVTGWVIGNLSPSGGETSKFNSQVEQASSTFLLTPTEPDGSIDTSVGDCWRSQNTYDGTFDTGDWTCYLTCIAVTNGSGQDLRGGFRVFSGANADGSGATERTSARQVGSNITNLTTSTQQTSSVTFSVTGWTTSGAEYIFIQVGAEMLGAGTMSNADADLRIGSTASRVDSANFTATPSTLTSLLLTGVGQ